MADAEELIKQAEQKAKDAAEAAAKEAETAAKAEGLSEDEVNRKVEAARKQEKDKLYDEIKDLRSIVAELKNTNEAERKEKERISREAKEREEQERQSKLSAEEKMAEKVKLIEEQLVVERKAREDLGQKAEESERRRKVEEYKREVLQGAGDELIRELVTGDTVEDVDRSVAVAKQKYQDYFDATVKKAEGGGKAPVTPGPSNPNPEAMMEEDLKGVFPVDPNYSADQQGKNQVSEKYLENRQAILDRVSAAYRRTQGR